MVNNTINDTATQLFNPNLDTSALISKIIFVGHYINDFLVKWTMKGFTSIGLLLNETQVSILYVIIYFIIAYAVISMAENIKTPLKFGIFILIGLLIIGFFKPN